MTIKRYEVTVIGATGKLAQPMIKQWVEDGVDITAIVRDVDKAQSVLPKDITLVKGNLQDVESLREGLKDTKILYLNLSTETLQEDLDFYPEREGVAHILEAVNEEKIEQIIKISGLGALHGDFSLEGMEAFPNKIRKQGQSMLRESGIPFTLFHPTWFLDSFAFFVRNGAFATLGTLPHPFFFTNTYDYANQVREAFGNPEAYNKDFAVQGKEAILFEDAARRCLDIVAPETPIRALPKLLGKLIGLFNPGLRFGLHMNRFFEQFREEFVAQQTWDVLGTPALSLEEFFEKKKTLFA